MGPHPNGVHHYSWRIMSNANLPALIEEISHEISRDEKGWYFTYASASRISGLDRKTIGGYEPAVSGMGMGVMGSKMLKACAGISPGGIEQFQEQWQSGRITDVFVSCLITYHATQKKGDKDPDVVALHGVLVAGGLRGLLDNAFGIEDAGGRVMARLNGIGTRVSYAKARPSAKEHWCNTAAVTTPSPDTPLRRGTRRFCQLSLVRKLVAFAITLMK